MFALGPLLGPIVGPIVGGFIAETIGWRWSFRILLIWGCVMSLLFFIFVDETNERTLLLRKAKRMNKELGLYLSRYLSL